MTHAPRTTFGGIDAPMALARGGLCGASFFGPEPMRRDASMYRNEILTGKEDRGLGVEARQATNNVRASSMCPATISRMHTLEYAYEIP